MAKLVLLVVAALCLGFAKSQNVDGGWSAWSPDPCCVGNDQVRKCDSPVRQGTGADCVGSPSQVCPTPGAPVCVNCTVNQWSGYSTCTKRCNRGSQFRTRTRRTPLPTPGSPACPTLNETKSCNTDFCRDALAGRGFVAWGPWLGPRTVRYLIASGGSDVDIFVFDQNAYAFYVEDQYRDKPFNTGYAPLRSMLQTDNADDTVTLGSGQNYYLVVDHTPVGAANGNDGQFNRVDFTWYFEGIGDAELGQSINTNPVINSAAQSAPAALLIACLCALLALVQ